MSPILKPTLRCCGVKLGNKLSVVMVSSCQDDYSMSVSQCLHLLAPEHGNNGIIWERHRHRYEVNPEFVDEIHDAGLKFVARDADSGTRMEIAELSTREHPYYIGCQYHPEFQSREMHPCPPSFPFRLF